MPQVERLFRAMEPTQVGLDRDPFCTCTLQYSGECKYQQFTVLPCIASTFFFQMSASKIFQLYMRLCACERSNGALKKRYRKQRWTWPSFGLRPWPGCGKCMKMLTKSCQSRLMFLYWARNAFVSTVLWMNDLDLNLNIGWACFCQELRKPLAVKSPTFGIRGTSQMSVPLQICADLCSARHSWGSLGVLPWWPQHVAGGQGWLGSWVVVVLLAVWWFWGPKWQNSASDGHCKACVRLFLPPQASLKLHSGQASETSWKFLEYLGSFWTVQSLVCSFCSPRRLIYVTSAGLEKVRRVLESSKLSGAFLPQNSKWRVETASKPAKAHSRGQPFSWYVPHRLGGDIVT